MLFTIFTITPVGCELQTLGHSLAALCQIKGVSAPAAAHSLLQSHVCNQDQHTWAQLQVWGRSPAHLDAGAGLGMEPSQYHRVSPLHACADVSRSERGPGALRPRLPDH